jgi:hypothetical protein
MFPATVERWRLFAREHARWAAERYGVELDEHDLLALIRMESTSKTVPGGGDPTAVSHSGCRGLGQFSGKALKSYNQANPGHELTWGDLIDPNKAGEQIRAAAWLVATGRKETLTWPVPDARSSNALWGDLYYGWGPKNTKTAIAAYRATHGGKAPTFAELEAAMPATFDGDGDGRIDLRPFVHARSVRKLAVQDRGEAPIHVPFPGAEYAGPDCRACCCAARIGGGYCPRRPVVDETKGG